MTSPLDQQMHQAIADAGGWLPFDRFMSLALYAPGLGYYANARQKFGLMPASGSDFVTAPELSPLFGEALAVQVGQAGKLLDNMLRALGLSRSEGPPERQVYIANTLKCRPPRNRNPEPSELAQCEPYLDRQIALIQPKVILAMGRFAVQSLLRSSDAIGRLRGRVHQYQGVPLVVTYHPAYLLRNLPDKALAWEDLCLAREALTSPP